MRRALPLIVLFVIFGSHVPQPENFTPAPVARNCRPTARAYETVRRRAGRTVTRHAIAASED